MERPHHLNELKTAVLEDGVCSWTCISDDAFSRYEYIMNLSFMAVTISFLPLVVLIIMIFTSGFSWIVLLSCLGFAVLFMLLFAALTWIQHRAESARVVSFRMNNDKIMMSDRPAGSYAYNRHRMSSSATVPFRKVRRAEPQPDLSRIILSRGILNHIILVPEDDFGPISEFILQRIDEAGRPG